MSHILLAPFGTSGSVFPYIWLGRKLIERGHRITMVASPIYRQSAEAAGIEFFAPVPDELSAMLTDADLWRQGQCKRVAFTYGARAIKPCMAAIDRVIGDVGKPDLMLAPMITFGARLAREKYGIPLITVHIYPAVMMSSDDAPIVFSAVRLIRRLPLPIRKFILGLPSPYDRYALPGIIEACAEHGVRPPKRLWKEWHHSPDGVLALFPSWFAGIKRDQPENTLQWEFPLEDMAHNRPMEAELKHFLASGERPIIFTAGTGHFHADEFFQTAANVVSRLGCRAVFLTMKPDQVPKNLPDSIFVATYAPFSKLLPLGAVMVHHGGIGTTSQCLAAGIPQLVVYMSLDQPDNAARVERLGVGLSISSNKLSEDRLLPLAKRCLTDIKIKANATKQAERMKQRQPLITLLTWIEDSLSRKLSRE